MKLEVGDYVRTKKGIAKILGRVNEPDNYYFKMLITDKYLEIHDDTEYIHDLDIIKSSKNIIDLIQVGDYVNGRPVFINEYGFLEQTCINADDDVYYETLRVEDIKDIVTKEQFDSMKYEVDSNE